MALAVPLCSLPQGNQLVAELLGTTFEFVFQSFALTLLFCGKKTFVISLSGGDQMENGARQFVGGRRDGGGGSMAGTHFSIVSAASIHLAAVLAGLSLLPKLDHHL